MNTIDISANGPLWEVTIDGWFQGTFDSLPEAYETAYRLSDERSSAEIVVHGDTPAT